MRRKPNADERRRELCDAAIQLLADEGAKGLRALRLEPVSTDRFRALNEPSRFGRVFGGQGLAQAMYGAAATVRGQLPHSLHAYFAATGDSDKPVDIVVERTRDGRSMSTRQVNVAQSGCNVLTAVASFHSKSLRSARVIRRSRQPGASPGRTRDNPFLSPDHPRWEEARACTDEALSQPWPWQACSP